MNATRDLSERRKRVHCENLNHSNSRKVGFISARSSNPTIFRAPSSEFRRRTFVPPVGLSKMVAQSAEVSISASALSPLTSCLAARSPVLKKKLISSSLSSFSTTKGFLQNSKTRTSNYLFHLPLLLPFLCFCSFFVPSLSFFVLCSIRR